MIRWIDKPRPKYDILDKYPTCFQQKLILKSKSPLNFNIFSVVMCGKAFERSRFVKPMDLFFSIPVGIFPGIVSEYGSVYFNNNTTFLWLSCQQSTQI